MATEQVITSNNNVIEWQTYEGTYECAVAIVKEDDCYIAYSMNFPGTASQGDTVGEAVENIKDALIGTIEVHKNRGDIPWVNECWFEGTPECVKRILINV